MAAADGKVAVLATGGTIASRPDAQTGVVARLGAQALVDSVPGIDALGPLEVIDVMQAGGYLITPEQMLQIAKTIGEVTSDDQVHGVVVTHGTDTMEETAYLCDLCHTGPEPVVFTGAQHHADTPDADGPRNLGDAIRIAHCRDARGAGALIAMAGRIDAAREATKMHTFAPQTFASFEHGKFGQVHAGAVTFFGGRQRPPGFGRLESIDANVVGIKLYAGIDGSFIDTAVANGASGVVLECFGVGNANHSVVESVRRASQAGTVVVCVSRCPAGTVAPVYGNGGGVDLADAGAIFGGNLSGQKARILLMAALGSVDDPVDVAPMLEPHLRC